MTSIYLVRHAQALGNLERRFQGHTDLPLTDLGRSQALFTAWRFRALPIAHVYSSPLQRAKHTASEITKALGLSVLLEPRLIEINGGEMENVPLATLKAANPEQYRRFFEEPHTFIPTAGGETYHQVYDRMREVIDELVERHSGESIVLVTHGCALRCLLGYVMGRSVEQMCEIPVGGNASVSHVLFPTGGTSRVAYSGDTSHLPDHKIT